MFENFMLIKIYSMRIEINPMLIKFFFMPIGLEKRAYKS